VNRIAQNKNPAILPELIESKVIGQKEGVLKNCPIHSKKSCGIERSKPTNWFIFLVRQELEKRNWLKYLLKNYLILKTPWFELT
jgi:ATP-dependent Clp protease ATP-binding subunit ClpC